jgi:phospholipid-translocating ATPase
MLTGDKLETAKCIGVCTGFKSLDQQYLELTSLSYREISNQLDEFDPVKHCLVVVGSTLEIIYGNGLLLDQFLVKCHNAESVIICRCAPKQKAQVAQSLKKKYGKVICCIGDGGNDVGMIKEASVGIGIEGKEGLQASLASDVSVKRFKDIEKLLLWHGRLSYQRTSKLANFVIHRGLIITVIQMIFICLYYYVSINIYNGYLVMGYSTVFTNFPVFSLILDKDIELSQVLDFPVLYSYTREGRHMNLFTFCIWLWKSIFQGACIIILSLYLVDTTFLTIVTVTFTALIFIGIFC